MGFIFQSGALFRGGCEGLESGPCTPCRNEQLTFLSCSNPPFTPEGSPSGKDSGHSVPHLHMGNSSLMCPPTDAPPPSSFRARGIPRWSELILTSGCLHLQTGCQVEWATWAHVSPGWVSTDSCVSETFSRSQLPWRALMGTHH